MEVVVDGKLPGEKIAGGRDNEGRVRECGALIGMVESKECGWS